MIKAKEVSGEKVIEMLLRQLNIWSEPCKPLERMPLGHVVLSLLIVRFC